LGSLPTEQKGDGNGCKNESAYDGTEDDPDFRFLFHGDDGGDGVCEGSRLNGTAVDGCSNFVAVVLVANWSRPDGVLEGKSKKNV
jgi:hypothetical protein